MDPSIGRKLAELRKARHLDLGVVARRARVDEDRLAAFEHGTPAVSTAAVARIASALNVSLDNLDEPIETADVSTFFFQNGAPDFFHRDYPTLVEGLRRARDYEEVLRWLGVTPRLREAFEPEPVSIPAYAGGYDLARRVRRTLGNETDAIPDMKALVEDDAGALVIVQQFAAKQVRALTARAESRGDLVVAVFLADQLGPETNVRWRVDLAHELSHVLFDPVEHATDVWIDTSEDQRQPWEQRARAFAAELLVPAAGLEARFGPPETGLSYERAVSLCEEAQRVFGASRDLVVNHLVNHAYVEAKYRESLLADVSPVAVAHESFNSSALQRRLLEAVELGAVTRARALELLGLSIYDDLPT